jgi:hypothetical protein
MSRARLLVVLSRSLAVPAVIAAFWVGEKYLRDENGSLGAVLELVALILAAASIWIPRYWALRDTSASDLAGRLHGMVRSRQATLWWQLLGGDSTPIDVTFAPAGAGSGGLAGTAPQGTLEQVGDFYRRLHPGRMVITGWPGAGKTVLAVKLMLALLEVRGPKDPVPVLVSAAAWDGEQRVDDLLIRCLVRDFHLSRSAAAKVVTERLVLPVVDGLDEMDRTPVPGYPSRMGKAVRLLDAYTAGDTRAPLVATCRADEYAALNADDLRIGGAAHVVIHPVGADDVLTFLEGRVTRIERWQDVLDAIDFDPDGVLARSLSDPWRLTQAVTVYERRRPDGGYVRDPAELTSPGFATGELVKDHLLGLFVSASRERRPRYTETRVHQWLAVLAAHLDRPGNRQPDLMLHELWPLAGRRLPKTIALAIALTGVLSLLIVTSSLFPRTLPVALPLLPLLLISFSGRDADPLWVDLHRLRTRGGRRALRNGLLAGLAIGCVAQAANVIIAGLWRHPDMALVWGALLVGLPLGVVFAFSSVGTDDVPDPRWIMWSDLWVLPLGLLVTGLSAGFLVGADLGAEIGVVAGLSTVLVIYMGLNLAAAPVGVIGLRYLGLLLCTRPWNRRPLPWRLGRFLTWCCDVGLMRTAGIGYQFRHRELQDYLAKRPVP